MFEKEAEEIANKRLCSKTLCFNHCNFNSQKHHRCGEWHRCYESAEDGAEFGYNKANEWHFVKDGDLPKDEEYKWCVSPSGYPYVARYEELFVSWTNRENKEVMCPYAWKEIVLPKEVE